MYLLGRQEGMSPGKEKTGTERLVEWGCLQCRACSGSQESTVCVFLRVGRVRWGGKWKLLSVWVVMVTQELCMTFLFGKIRIFLDGTLRTCLCH